MIQEQSGFVYETETKYVIVEFQIGNDVYLGEGCDIFYGTEAEAIQFGLIFNTGDYDAQINKQ